MPNPEGINQYSGAGGAASHETPGPGNAHPANGAPLPPNATPAQRYAQQTRDNAAHQASGRISGPGVAPKGGRFK